MQTDERLFKFLSNCQALISIAILIFDHLLTIDQEVRFIWPQPTSRRSLSFLALRYITLTGYIGVLFGAVITPATGSACKPIVAFWQFLLLFTHAFVFVLLSLRVFALYGGSKKILCTLLITMCIVVGVAITSILLERTQAEPLSFLCVSQLSQSSILWQAAAWEGVALGDVVVLTLILSKSFFSIRRKHLEGHSPLWELIVHDAALYSSIMLLANALNIATFYIKGNPVGSLSSLSSCIAVTMMSPRFITQI